MSLGPSTAVAPSASALLSRSWDYVIVGAGAAGCVLAARLSEDPNTQVLLIEAGGEGVDPAIASPQAWPMLQGGAFDWNYRSAPQAGLDGRVLAQPRGKGLGGSTLINAMGFQRGPRQAYDRWASDTGYDDLGYDALLPYFKTLETASGGPTAYRGGDGPLHVLQVGEANDRNAHALAIAEAGLQAGQPPNADWNGARADGVCWTQLSIRDGRRDTAATAYLDPIRSRRNLGVLTGALATRLIMDETVCRGVTVVVDGEAHAILAARDTILCAGALDTPRLLLLSGVGPADALKAVGVAPVIDRPGVGRNLQDHPLAPGLLFQSPQALPPSHYNHCEVMVVGESSRSPGWADIQVMGLSVPFLHPDLGAAPADSFSFVPCVLAPKSRGSVTLACADPAAPAVIDPGYLSDPDDLDAMIDAFALARRVAAAPAMRPWIDKELFPGAAVRDRAALGAYLRQISTPFFHPVSTCRMGPASDAMAVVDRTHRVHGVGGLRVVDASVFPSIPQAMTAAAVFAVAERAAALIRGSSS